MMILVNGWIQSWGRRRDGSEPYYGENDKNDVDGVVMTESRNRSSSLSGVDLSHRKLWIQEDTLNRVGTGEAANGAASTPPQVAAAASTTTGSVGTVAASDQQTQRASSGSASGAMTQGQSQTSLSASSSSSLPDDPPRPIIHTYYQPVRTDMGTEGDRELLKAWKQAWYDAGWQPKIVTLEHAMLVPEYQALVDLVVDPDFIGGYNMQCYIRWIAMAGAGGGFMADYDVFPLNHFLRHGRELPYDGAMTIYQKFVPALVSGVASEYLRIAKRIGESMHKHVYMQKYINENSAREHHKNRVPWSDMKALDEMYNHSKRMFIMRFDVLAGEAVLSRENFTSADCHFTRNMRAVHFSHRSIKEGKQPLKLAKYRSIIARQFLNRWHQVCKAEPVPDL